MAVMGFALILALIGNAGNFAWALIGSGLQRFLRRHGRIVNRAMGAMLLASAVGLLY